MSFLAMDDPRHMRMRQLVSKGFTPRRVAELQERTLELTLGHLEPALAGGEFDWITDFAARLPMDVISELMGVPEADRAECGGSRISSCTETRVCSTSRSRRWTRRCTLWGTTPI